MNITQLVVMIFVVFAFIVLMVVDTLIFGDPFNYPLAASFLAIMLLSNLWLREKMS